MKDTLTATRDVVLAKKNRNFFSRKQGLTDGLHIHCIFWWSNEILK